MQLGAEKYNDDPCNISKSQPIMPTAKLSLSFAPQDDEDSLHINLDEITPIKPPDGGYAWVIMIASFICMVLVDGVCFSYGLLIEDLQDHFDSSKAITSFGGSLLTGSYLIFGPVASGLSNFYDHRKLVLVGTIISSAGIAVSSLVNSIYAFVFIFGVIGGFGFSLIYLPANTIISLWFFKRRATAIGISACGSGIGGIVFAFIMPILVNQYSWRGCVLIISAINLNCAVAASLMIPIEKYQTFTRMRTVNKLIWTKADLEKVALPTIGKEIPVEFERQRSSSMNDNNAVNSQFLKTPRLGHGSVLLNDTMNTTSSLAQNELNSTSRLTLSKNNLKEVIRQMAMDQVASERAKKFSFEQNGGPSIYSSQMLICAESERGDQLKISSTSIPAQLQMSTVNRLVEQAVLDQLARNNNNHDGNISSQVHLPTDELKLQHETPFGTAQIAQSSISLCGTKIEQMGDLKQAVLKKLKKEMSRPAHRQDYLYSGSMVQLNKLVSTTNIDDYMRQVQDPEEPGTDSRHPIIQMLQKMLNFEVLKGPTALLLIISGVFTMMGYLVPYMFLPNLAREYPNVDSKGAANILSYLSIANTIGRAGAGILSDFPCINPIWLNNFSLLLSGTILIMVPLMRHYAGLVAVAVIYGGLISVFVSVRVVVLVQLLGLNKLTNALGVLLLFQGTSMVVSTPFLGWFYDQLLNYNVTFILGGTAIMFSGLICFPLTCLSSWENNYEKGDPTIASCFRMMCGCCRKTSTRRQSTAEELDDNQMRSQEANF